MKTGKVSESILKRSVLRPLGEAGLYPGADYYHLPNLEQPVQVLCSASASLGGCLDLSVDMLLQSVVNNLALSGGEAAALNCNVLLPTDLEEKELQGYMKQVADFCRSRHLKLAGGHTQVSRAVNQPILAVTGLGSAAKDEAASRGMTADQERAASRAGTVNQNEAASRGMTADQERAASRAGTVNQKDIASRGMPGSEPARMSEIRKRPGPRAGQELVMTKSAGLAGTVLLVRQFRTELEERYPALLLDTAEEFAAGLSIEKEARIALDNGAAVLHDVSQGGVFGALWELAEAAGVGLEADLRKIPIRQETVEISDFFGINPYQLYGQGALLAVAEDGEQLVEEWKQNGIPAAVIGRITDSRDRVFRNGSECRFLERPQQDSLWKFREERENGGKKNAGTDIDLSGKEQ